MLQWSPMEKEKLEGVAPAVAEKIGPMVEEILTTYGSSIHSMHIVGSAVAPDYNEKTSDINSVVVLHSMDLKFVEFLAPLGKKYGKRRIAAPLIMTPEYIRRSLDAFPIEFHDFRLIHKTINGQDILSDLQIDRAHLRIQCEREIKTKLIGLRQGYISSLGKRDLLTSVLISSFTGCMALFRAIIVLLDREPPIRRAEVVSVFGDSTRIDTAPFTRMLELKTGRGKLSKEELLPLFELYYMALEATGKIIDELPSK